MRRFALIGFTICLLTSIAFYLHLTGRFGLLRRTPQWKVEVNGAVVDGGVLVGRAFAVVTRRDKGKEHSYALFYEGDVDQTGDMGRVIDCREWIAPKLPILIETRNYPMCKVRPHARASGSRLPLTAKNGAPQFLTVDGDVISIRQR